MIVFLEGFKSIKFNGPFTESLYEHGKYNDIRVLLNEPPLYILTAPIRLATPKIRVSVGLSEVTLFRSIATQSPITSSEMVYCGLMRVTDNDLELHLFPLPYADLFDRANVFFNKEPVIVLDLDKTLIVTEHDVPFLDESFVPHFTVTGNTIIEQARFEHRIMIRPDCHTFLTYLFKLTSKVYILTASDLHYAEQVVQSANACGWGGGIDGCNLSFPLGHIYSVRNKPLTALPKTFSRIIPFKLCERSPVCIGVDDSLTAWDPSVSHRVIPVPPFTSIHEKNVLLDIANRIHTACYVQLDVA
jgi:hypothetical protein